MSEKKTSLNTASAEELTELPGIGPTLAERIVTYRSSVARFEDPAEITTISGIGDTTYRAIEDRLTVNSPEEATAPAEEGPLEQPGEERGTPGNVVGAQASAPDDSMPEEHLDFPEPEARGPWAQVGETRGEGGEQNQAGIEQEPEERIERGPPDTQDTPPEPEVAPEQRPTEHPPAGRDEPPIWTTDREPTPPPSFWSQLSWLWTALLGGFLGMVFALVVFAGINGSLDVASSRAVLEIEGRMEGLASDVDVLQGTVDGLNRRVTALEGLATRMDSVEAAVDDLRGETAELVERTDGLEQQVTAVSDELEIIADDVTTLQDQAQRTESFFLRLQALLDDLFGEADGQSTPLPEDK